MKFFFSISIALLIGLFGGYFISEKPTQVIKTNTQTLTVEVPQTINDDYHKKLALNLKNEVDKANAEIAYLQRTNFDLTEKLQQSFSNKAKKQELERQIDNMPESYLTKQLERKIRIDSFDEIEDVHQFSKNLLDAALEDTDYDTSENIDITFGFSSIRNTQSFSGSVSAAISDKIFAFISTSVDSSDVLVKWHNIETGELLRFKNMKVSKDKYANFVSTTPKKGWSKGSYRVTVFKPDQIVSPIGSRSFTISDITDIPNNSSEQINNELIASGQTSAKLPK